jgi:predicted nucleic acid-binding protein
MAEIGRRLRRDEDILLAAHSLVESYSVLTRMPRQTWGRAEAVRRALHASFESVGRVTALSAEEYVALLDDAVTLGIIGGAMYDALLARCAQPAGVDVILTFNERHFRRFASPTLQIVVPSV